MDQYRKKCTYDYAVAATSYNFLDADGVETKLLEVGDIFRDTSRLLGCK